MDGCKVSRTAKRLSPSGRSRRNPPVVGRRQRPSRRQPRRGPAPPCLRRSSAGRGNERAPRRACRRVAFHAVFRFAPTSTGRGPAARNDSPATSVRDSEERTTQPSRRAQQPRARDVHRRRRRRQAAPSWRMTGLRYSLVCGDVMTVGRRCLCRSTCSRRSCLVTVLRMAPLWPMNAKRRRRARHRHRDRRAAGTSTRSTRVRLAAPTAPVRSTA